MSVGWQNWICVAAACLAVAASEAQEVCVEQAPALLQTSTSASRTPGGPLPGGRAAPHLAHLQTAAAAVGLPGEAGAEDLEDLVDSDDGYGEALYEPLVSALDVSQHAAGLLEVAASRLQPPIREGIRFEPEVWNTEPAVLASHNCFMYALNDIHLDVFRDCEAVRADPVEAKKYHNKAFKGCRKFFHKPGYYFQHHVEKRHMTDPWSKPGVKCNFVMPQLFSDNPMTSIWANEEEGRMLEETDACPADHYMVALVIHPERGFHFYRKDHYCRRPENKGLECWSHKPGILPATDEDAGGNEIPSVRQANRDYGRNNYSDVCGFFCVPFNGAKETHSDHHKPHPSA